MPISNGTRTIGWDSIDSSVDEFELKIDSRSVHAVRSARPRDHYVISRVKRDLATLSQLETIYGLTNDQRVAFMHAKDAMRDNAITAFATVIRNI